MEEIKTKIGAALKEKGIAQVTLYLGKLTFNYQKPDSKTETVSLCNESCYNKSWDCHRFEVDYISHDQNYTTLTKLVDLFNNGINISRIEFDMPSTITDLYFKLKITFYLRISTDVQLEPIFFEGILTSEKNQDVFLLTPFTI